MDMNAGVTVPVLLFCICDRGGCQISEVEAPSELVAEAILTPGLQGRTAAICVSTTPKAIAGSITLGQDASVSLTFLPQDVSIFVGTVICKQPNDHLTSTEYVVLVLWLSPCWLVQTG
jgi:hypothetical protein